MTKWISQKDCPSTTDAAIKRTAYLAPLAEQVKQAIEAYLTQHTTAKDVTLEVCERVGREALEQIGPDVNASRRNTDFGLFVAQKLVEIYGDTRVLTLRQNDGTSAQTRSNHRPAVDWVTAYTPHLVLPVTSAGIHRILLDTSVVRQLIHDDTDALDRVPLEAAPR